MLGGYDPAQFEQRREWATAEDGTKVPISLVYPVGAEPDLGAADLAAVEPQGAAREPGQEGPVMADHDECALEPVEPVLEPLDRPEV